MKITPTVSIVIPCRNEERFIATCLDSILANDYPKDVLEVLVVDGMSVDRTRLIVDSYRQKHSFIRLLDNSRESTPAAMNLGIKSAMGEVIIINSAHSAYPADFISKAVEWLSRTGADVVGGPLMTVPGARTPIAQAIALASGHRFGVGNSKFRISCRDGNVDTVPFGAYRRETFDRVGVFDERLERNQDMELSSRIIRGRGRIYMTGELQATYYSRPTLGKLARQAFRNGLWNVPMIRITPSAFRWRHFVPFCFVGALCGLALGSAVLPWCRLLLLVLLCAYVMSAIVASLEISWRSGFRTIHLLPFVFGVLHIAYGVGTWCGLAQLLVAQWSRPAISPISASEV